MTAQPLPLPWLKGDIGTGMLAGSLTYNAGTFTQAGSGVIGSTSDNLNFTYQTLTGDGEIIARISVLQDTGTSSRVGVMIRDTLAANSMHIFMGMTGTNAYRWVRRTTTGGTTSSSNCSAYKWIHGAAELPTAAPAAMNSWSAAASPCADCARTSSASLPQRPPCSSLVSRVLVKK